MKNTKNSNVTDKLFLRKKKTPLQGKGGAIRGKKDNLAGEELGRGKTLAHCPPALAKKRKIQKRHQFFFTPFSVAL